MDIDDNSGPVVGLEQGNFIDLLRQDLDEIKQNKSVLIPVIGYERTGLQAKYRMATGKELDTIARKVMREVKDNYSRNLNISMDSMIALCEGLYVQLPEMDQPAELDPLNRGEAVRFDHTLAEALGWEDVNSARLIVRRLFDNNEIAINTHAEKLFRWVRNTDADVEAELLGSGEL